jgi:hypothetical protein
MKNYKHICIIMIAILAVASLAVFAATEQWRYDGWHIVYQVAADGTGGCAVYRVTTNGSASIVWLDKNGQAKYDRVSEQVPLLNPIIYCNKKNGLAFAAVTGSSTNKVMGLILVDKKLNESVMTAPGKHLMPGSYPYGSTGTSTTDKKGFFAVEMSTNGVGATLIRYTYK